MGSELGASERLTLEMIFLPIKLRVTAASACRTSDTVFRRKLDSRRQRVTEHAMVIVSPLPRSVSSP